MRVEILDHCMKLCTKSLSFTSQVKILEKLVLCISNSNKWNVTEILFEKPIKIQHWL
jgi:hypothetical protein